MRARIVASFKMSGLFLENISMPHLKVQQCSKYGFQSPRPCRQAQYAGAAIAQDSVAGRVPAQDIFFPSPMTGWRTNPTRPPARIEPLRNIANATKGVSSLCASVPTPLLGVPPMHHPARWSSRASSMEWRRTARAALRRASEKVFLVSESSSVSEELFFFPRPPFLPRSPADGGSG